MNQVHFYKFEGSGNDFILLQDFKDELEMSSKWINDLCNRSRGIGADGVLLLKKSSRANAKMHIYNSDGSEAEMCGNGLRCVCGYLKLHLFPDRDEFLIESRHQLHCCSVVGHEVEVSLGTPEIQGVNEVFSTLHGDYDVQRINTGVPHGVIFRENVDSEEFTQISPLLRSHEKVLPVGMNVDFVQILDYQKALIKVRTFERGVEGETASCGSGAAAAAVASCMQLRFPSEITIETTSKDYLKCRMKYKEEIVEEVFLKGPFRCVFQGFVDVKWKTMKAYGRS